MPRHIAFLRAINVGGHTVKMDRLRGLFEALGFSNVETFIASGNVLFASPARGGRALEKKIEAALHGALGYEVAAFLRAPRELAAVARHQPFPPAEANVPGHSLYVAFLHAPPGPAARQGVLALRGRVDDFHLDGREVYYLRRGTSADTEFSGARLEKALGAPATMRNLTTVRKLAARLAAPVP